MYDVNTVSLKVNFWRHHMHELVGYVGNLAGWIRFRSRQENWTRGQHVHITKVKTVDCKRLNDFLLPNEMELTINEKCIILSTLYDSLRPSVLRFGTGYNNKGNRGRTKRRWLDIEVMLFV